MRRALCSFGAALLLALPAAASAPEKPFQPRVVLGDIHPDKVRQQNREVVRLAAQSLSEGLPKKIDDYTTLRSIDANDTTLLYTFVLDVGPKEDEEIRKEGETRMRPRIIDGICRSSARFLQAGITVAYRYLNKASGKELFRIDVDQKVCEKAGFRF
ncbi:hypothetical protein [Nitratifractor sp.]